MNLEVQRGGGNVAAIFMKWAAVIFLGVGCQRVAAVPVEDPELFAVSNLPQTATQEIARMTRQPSLKQRRRKPRMAGVPSGLQALVVQAPESVSPTAVARAASTQEAQNSKTFVAPQARAQEFKNTDMPATSEGDSQDDEGDKYTPGALARSKAAYTQGLIARQYRRAPIKWGGTVTESLGMNNRSTIGVPSSALTLTSHVQTVQVGAQTFILQPWIATVIGRIGVVSGINSAAYLGGSNQQRQNSLFGGGNLALFAQSRFPFELRYEATDSRTSEGSSDQTVAAGGSDTTGKKLNLAQTYRPLGSSDIYKLFYSRDNTTDKLVGDKGRISDSGNVDSVWHGDYSALVGSKQDQPFDMTASHQTSTSTNSLGKATNKTASVSARHVYMPEDSLLTLNSDVNLFQSSRLNFASRNIMLGSHGSWQPEDEDTPLILRGSARLFQLKNTIYATSSNTQTLSANLEATYSKWERIPLMGGVSVVQSKVGKTSILNTTEYANTAYRFDVVNLGKNMPYVRSANAGFTNYTSSATGGANFAVYGGANHSLTMPYEFSLFGYGSQLSSGLSQGATVRVDRFSGASETLNHGGSIAWSPTLKKSLPSIGDNVNIRNDSGGKISARSGGTARLINNVTLGFSDSRTFGAAPAHIRTIRLSGAMNGLGRYKAATDASGYGGNANVSMEVVRQSSGQSSAALVSNASWAYNYIYDYTYKKPKLMGVRGLDYALALKANAGTGLNAAGTRTAAQTTQTTGYNLSYGFAFDQSLRYRIGQNEALLTASLADNYGIKTASLFLRFRAWRNFGN